jgi:hypothetical protein
MKFWLEFTVVGVILTFMLLGTWKIYELAIFVGEHLRIEWLP